MPMLDFRHSAKRVAVTLLIGAAAVSVGGCASILGVADGSEYGDNSPPDRESVVEVPSDREIEESNGSKWECYYDPTMNEDWHDDVTCSNGMDSVRPELLPEQDFVTESDMVAAGNEYAAELNE